MDLSKQPLTDTGNAERLALLFGDRLRHAPRAKWVHWADTHWKPSTIQPIAAAKAMCREAYAQFLAWPMVPADAKATRDAALSFARRAENATGLRNTLFCAESEPPLAVNDADFNKDPWLLTCRSGTIDLHTGDERAHQREDLITCCAPVSLAMVPSLTFTDFLETIQPDPETRAWVQRLLGMALIGEQLEHVIIIATGTGGNGKGTLFRAIHAALGPDLYCVTPSTTFQVSKEPPHPAAIMAFEGKRLVVSNELPSGKALDENRLKELSGGDPITARGMGENPQTFRASHTTILCCNDKPAIIGTDRGFWRRLRVLPFPVEIPQEQMDRDLDARLAADKDGIFCWLIDGLRMFLRDGLGTCPEVDYATRQYRQEEDLFGAALELFAVAQSGEHNRIDKTQFYLALTKACTALGLPEFNARTISRELSRRGVSTGRGDGARFWQGIRFDDLAYRRLTSTSFTNSDYMTKHENNQ